MSKVIETSYFRGYLTELRSDLKWYYSDNGLPTIENWKDRGCGFCGKKDTPEGHDGCLGTLPGVINACCGHGHNGAYVQFNDGSIISGDEAIQKINELRK